MCVNFVKKIFCEEVSLLPYADETISVNTVIPVCLIKDVNGKVDSFWGVSTNITAVNINDLLCAPLLFCNRLFF